MKQVCEYCKLEFEEDEIEAHKFKCVSSFQNDSFSFENKIPCEICNELIEFDKYNEHINICSMPSRTSIPILLNRYTNTSQNLLRLFNIPIPSEAQNVSEIQNLSNPTSPMDVDNNEEENNSILEDNLNNNQPVDIDNNNNSTENINQNLDVESPIPQENIADDLNYNVELMNYNINLINNILRNTRYQNPVNHDSYESFSQLDNQVVKTGLDIKKVSEQIKIGEKTTCPICLDDYNPPEIFRKLKCQHSYCEDCLEEWLEENKKCPVCMVDL